MSSDIFEFEEIVAWVAGELDEAGARRVQDRLAADPRARELAAKLRHAIEGLAGVGEGPSAGVVSWVRGLSRRAGGVGAWLDSAGLALARLVFDSRRPGALVGLRGATAGYHLRYASELGEVDIQVDPASPTEASRRLRGQVELTVPVSDAAVVMEPLDGEAGLRGVVDGTGVFELIARVGLYELRVERAGSVVMTAAPVDVT